MSQATVRNFNIPWDKLEPRAHELMDMLASGVLDQANRQAVQKELTSINRLLAKHKEVQTLKQEVDQTKEQLHAEQDEELKELFFDEVKTLEDRLQIVQQELTAFLFPTDELDDRAAFLEIRAGTGGQEASLFAADLAKMYMNYATKRGWRVAVTSSSETDLGGFREIVLHIQGKKVFGDLKYESGVHRVQRVPATEASGRVHTSTATVAILPEAEEVDVRINPADLRIDVFRASGAGGQHVNTTDSAVRITHVPTGVVVSCQDERSQHKNKAKALKILQSRILAAQQAKQQAEVSQTRKELVGTGMRAEKVRTYNYPQNRITDHQVNLTLKKLDYIMQGNLDEIMESLRQHDLEQRSQQLPTFLKNLQH